MLSRIADSLFWTSRYMERTDGLLRSCLTNYIVVLDKGSSNQLSWQHVLELFSTYSSKEIEQIKFNTDTVLQRLITDPENINALTVIVSKARENARGVQDHITKEVWEQVNQTYHTVNAANLVDRLMGYQSLETIDSFIKEVTLYNGVTDTTMPRGLGWSFMNLGRYLERCFITLEIADKFFSFIQYDLEDEKDILQWKPMLLALSGFELHLKTYRSNSSNINALHQVVFNENFTRSILYSLSRIEKYLKDVLENNNADYKPIITKQFGRLLSSVAYKDIKTLNKLTLHQFFKDTKKELNEFSKLLGQSFFSYS